MSKREEYTLSINLIKEAENLIKESQNLLNDIKNRLDDQDKTIEIENLKKIIKILKMRNDNLFMENVLLKSKVKELSILKPLPCNSISKKNILLKRK